MSKPTQAGKNGGNSKLEETKAGNKAGNKASAGGGNSQAASSGNKSTAAKPAGGAKSR